MFCWDSQLSAHVVEKITSIPAASLFALLSFHGLVLALALAFGYIYFWQLKTKLELVRSQKSDDFTSQLPLAHHKVEMAVWSIYALGLLSLSGAFGDNYVSPSLGHLSKGHFILWCASCFFILYIGLYWVKKFIVRRVITSWALVIIWFIAFFVGSLVRESCLLFFDSILFLPSLVIALVFVRSANYWRQINLIY